MARGYCQVGTVDAVRGTKGEVRLRQAADAPCPLAPGMGVVLVPPTLEDRRRKAVEGVREEGGDVYLRLSGVRDRASASLCVGRAVLAREADLPEGWGREAGAGLVGLAVRDEAEGDLGRVVAVERGAFQSLLVVEGPLGQALVPAVPPILVGVEGGVVRVACPPGLLELARGGD